MVPDGSAGDYSRHRICSKTPFARSKQGQTNKANTAVTFLKKN